MYQHIVVGFQVSRPVDSKTRFSFSISSTLSAQDAQLTSLASHACADQTEKTSANNAYAQRLIVGTLSF
jgi:hypothetical protein